MATISLGIDKSLLAIADFKKLGVDTAIVVKTLLANPASVPGYFKLAQVVGDLLAEVRDIIAAVPELKDLDAGESTILTASFWDACREIVSAALGMAYADQHMPKISDMDVEVAAKLTEDFYEGFKKLVAKKAA